MECALVQHTHDIVDGCVQYGKYYNIVHDDDLRYMYLSVRSQQLDYMCA